MATVQVDRSNQYDGTKDDPLLLVTNGLKLLKYDYSIEQVKTSHFIFSTDVDDFKLENLSDFGREVLQNYLHIGIVSDACEKPYKQYEVLLVHWPSNIPRSFYGEKSSAHLVKVKKVRTIIFAVPEKRLNNYMQYHKKIPMDDVIASTAIITQTDDWRLMESKVMSSFFNIVDRSFSHVTERRDTWKTYPTNSLDTQWKQMLFLCCFNYDVGYHVLKMTARNWSRISRRMAADDNYEHSGNLLDVEVPRGGIYDLLVIWSRPALFRDMIEFLKEVNVQKPCCLPLDILEKAKLSLVTILFVTKRFACEVCGQACVSNFKLITHMRTHTGAKPFKCKICNRQFSQSPYLTAHLRAHKGENSFHCEYCGRSFAYKATLKYHLACKHHANGDFNLKCFSCKTQYESGALLREHVATHANDKKFQCKICVRRFVTESDLVKHTQNHSKDKPFDCHICGKKFMLKHNLKKHYKIHSEKSVMCGFCGKAFVDEVSRRKHELFTHDACSSKLGSFEVKSKDLVN